MLTILLLSMSVCNADVPEMRDTDMVGVTSSRLEEIRERHGVPALAAFAMKGDRIEWIGVTGTRSRGSEAPVTTDDRWHLGSCGKAITATVLQRLVDRGTIAWSTTVAEVFPEAEGSGWTDVTLRDLVTHRSGLPEDRQPDPGLMIQMRMLDGSLPDQRRHLVKMMLERAVLVDGEPRMRYSNLGYVIASAMAETRSGRAWEDLCVELLFQPLGMASTGFGAPGSATSLDQPRGHGVGQGLPPSPIADNPPVMAAAGTIHASLRDWSRFLAEHVRGARGEDGLLSFEAIQGLHRPPGREMSERRFFAVETVFGRRPSSDGGRYASGWVLVRRSWCDGWILMHDGTNGLWYAMVWVAPECDWAFAAVANQGGEPGARACGDSIRLMLELLSSNDSTSESPPKTP